MIALPLFENYLYFSFHIHGCLAYCNSVLSHPWLLLRPKLWSIVTSSDLHIYSSGTCMWYIGENHWKSLRDLVVAIEK